MVWYILVIVLVAAFLTVVTSYVPSIDAVLVPNLPVPNIPPRKVLLYNLSNLLQVCKETLEKLKTTTLQVVKRYYTFGS